MKLLIALLLCFVSVFGWGDTHVAASASYADVNTAVTAATYGDTVTIPAGTETWNTILALTKGIFLQGNGAGSTIITAGTTRIITYVPDATTRANQDTIEITGFTFAGAPGTAVIELDEPNNETVPIRNVSIHDNTFTNTTGYPISVDGNFWGVVYENTFTGNQYFQILGNDEASFTTFYPASYGTADNLYFEDNILTGAVGHFGINSGQGGRWVWRYNDHTDGHMDNPMLDQHGPQIGDIWGLMVCEIYGNLFTDFVNESNKWDYQRGGKLLMFNNRGNHVPANGLTLTVHSTFDPGEPPIQHPHDTYFWNNWWDGSLVDATEGEDVAGHIDENSEFFNYAAGFDGTVGIGIGSTAPEGNCTAGVGYWVTAYSPGTTPPTTMADMRTYCQAGVLYKATATNTWTLYYRPYTYPHPLTAGGGPPGLSGGSKYIWWFFMVAVVVNIGLAICLYRTYKKMVSYKKCAEYFENDENLEAWCEVNSFLKDVYEV